MNDPRSNEWTHPEGNEDDNMHDPRRAEVPTLDRALAMVDAKELCRAGDIEPTEKALNYLTWWLQHIYNDGAIAGMKAQYEHDQKRAASQR